jgi:hypothetical protein
MGPSGERCPSSEPSTHKFPVNEPLSKLPSGVPFQILLTELPERVAPFPEPPPPHHGGGGGGVFVVVFT